MKKLCWPVIVGAVVGVMAGLLHAEMNVPAALKNKTNLVDCVVIGAGVAGNMAAIQAKRLGLEVVQFEGNQVPQLCETGYVENWPGIVRALGNDIMQAQRKQVEHHEVTTITETVNAFDGSLWPYRITTDAGTVVHALSVIVATGSSPRKLGVPGEDRFWGNGVSTCALCDGPLYKNKSVVVVGGGDSAVEEAVQLAGLVGKVTMLVRGDRLRASDAMQKKLENVANIVVRYGCQLSSIIGTDDGVTGVEVYDVHTQKTETLATQAVFLAIGHEPRTQLFNGVLELTSDNYIQVAANDRTVNNRTVSSQAASLPGVFAAGDVAASDGVKAHFRQAGVALGEGQKAAEEAYLFLQERGLTTPVLKSLRSGSLGAQFYRRVLAH